MIVKGSGSGCTEAEAERDERGHRASELRSVEMTQSFDPSETPVPIHRATEGLSRACCGG